MGKTLPRGRSSGRTETDSVRRATNRAFGAEDELAETESEGFGESSEFDEDDDDVNPNKALRGLNDAKFVGFFLN